MIRAIGNSHTCFFNGTDEIGGISWWKAPQESTHDWIAGYSIGPCTAWKFKKKHLPRVRCLLKDIGADKEKDKLVLVFGEIDCRVHIPRVVEATGVGLVEATEKCWRAYEAGVNELLDEGWKIVLYTCAPAREITDPAILVCGSVATRNAVINAWNYFLWSKALNLRPRIEVLHLAPDSLTYIDEIHLSQDCWNLEPDRPAFAGGV